MAFAQQGTVLRFDADNQTYSTIAPMKICGFKLIGGADASTAMVKDTDTNGTILWQGRCAINTDLLDQIYLRAGRTIHVDFTGTGPVLYVYLE